MMTCTLNNQAGCTFAMLCVFFLLQNLILISLFLCSVAHLTNDVNNHSLKISRKRSALDSSQTLSRRRNVMTIYRFIRQFAQIYRIAIATIYVPSQLRGSADSLEPPRSTCFCSATHCRSVDKTRQICASVESKRIIKV